MTAPGQTQYGGVPRGSPQDALLHAHSRHRSMAERQARGVRLNNLQTKVIERAEAEIAVLERKGVRVPKDARTRTGSRCENGQPIRIRRGNARQLHCDGCTVGDRRRNDWGTVERKHTHDAPDRRSGEQHRKVGTQSHRSTRKRRRCRRRNGGPRGGNAHHTDEDPRIDRHQRRV